MSVANGTVLDEDVLVVGAGVVGRATATLLASIGCAPVLIDKNEKLVQELLASGFDADVTPRSRRTRMLAFVCVPTPLTPEDRFDLTAVLSAVGELVKLEKLESLTIVLRSTVTPGTCARITGFLEDYSRPACEHALVYMPEFLRQATAELDVLAPRAIVLASQDVPALNRLKDLLAPYHHSIIIANNFQEAEMIKIAHNAWNSTKISFWNEMFQIGLEHGLDVDCVSRVVAVTAEASWNPNYGTKGGRPFGGACLPKDLAAFISHARDLGITPRMLIATQQINESEMTKGLDNGDPDL